MDTLRPEKGEHIIDVGCGRLEAWVESVIQKKLTIGLDPRVATCFPTRGIR
jgi:hypothetical protein